MQALALLILMLCPATLTPTREKSIADQVNVAPKPRQLVVTDDTVIEVDGKKCGFKDVPDGAEVIQIEVGKDGKTVLKLGFRTKK
jgi:hypothetical protein